MAARDFRFEEDFREKERLREEPTLSRWCSATVKILFLADNAETRPNEIAIAPANVHYKEIAQSSPCS